MRRTREAITSTPSTRRSPNERTTLISRSGICVAVCEKDRIAFRLSYVFYTGDHFGHERIRDRSHYDADRLRALCCEAPAYHIGPIAHGARDVPYPLRGIAVYGAGILERPRNG